jgi:hypothetical protein
VALRSIAASWSSYSLGVRRAFRPQEPPREIGDGSIREKTIFLPIEVVIALAINLVIIVLGYYAMMMWGLFRG